MNYILHYGVFQRMGKYIYFLLLFSMSRDINHFYGTTDKKQKKE